MRIIVIADLHANLPALDAILEAIRQEGYDEIIHLGDAVGLGPYPSECLERLLNTANASLVMGNHDAWLVHGLPESQPEWLDYGNEFTLQLWTNVQCNTHWTHAQINRQLRSFVAQWPFQITREFEGAKATFQHYALTKSGQGFKPLVMNPTVDDLDRLFVAHRSDIAFRGHDHSLSDRTGRTRYVNPGPSGCQNGNSARYCVAELGKGTCTLECHSVEYDDLDLFRAFKSRKVPGRRFFYQVFFGGRFGC